MPQQHSVLGSSHWGHDGPSQSADGKSKVPRGQVSVGPEDTQAKARPGPRPPPACRPQTPALQSQEEVRGPLKGFSMWETEPPCVMHRGQPRTGVTATDTVKSAPSTSAQQARCCLERPMSGSSGPRLLSLTDLPMTHCRFERKQETQCSFHCTDRCRDRGPGRALAWAARKRSPHSSTHCASKHQRSASLSLSSVSQPLGGPRCAAPRNQVNDPILRFKIQKFQIQNFLTVKLYGVFTKQSCFFID